MVRGFCEITYNLVGPNRNLPGSQQVNLRDGQVNPVRTLPTYQPQRAVQGEHSAGEEGALLAVE